MRRVRAPRRQLFALCERPGRSALLHPRRILPHRFELSQEFGRDLRTVHGWHRLDSGDARDRHDSGDNGHFDPELPFDSGYQVQRELSAAAAQRLSDGSKVRPRVFELVEGPEQ